MCFRCKQCCPYPLTLPHEFVINEQGFNIKLTKGALKKTIEATENYKQKSFFHCQLVAEHDETRECSEVLMHDLPFVLDLRKPDLNHL